MTRRWGTYIFKRKGSNNWYVRIQETKPTRRTVEKSLGTPDRVLAEYLALKYIVPHKYFLVRSRNEGKMPTKKEYEPGLHYLDDGSVVYATEDRIDYLDNNNKLSESRPNKAIIDLCNLENNLSSPRERESISDMREMFFSKKTQDDVVENWITYTSASPYVAKDALKTWAEFLEFTKKPVQKCTRDDGRRFYDHLRSKGLKTQTVQKKISFLRAAINIAIDDGKLKTNPFAKLNRAVEDKCDRIPFSPEDMALVDFNILKLSKEDQILWYFLAATGARLSEPYSVIEEFSEDGIRFVIFGAKSRSSRRRVPIPDRVLPMLPERIDQEHPIVSGKPAIDGKRLNRFIRSIGIKDKRKVLHSLRHRAKDRLRASGCPLDVQFELLGHEKITVADGYGKGSPVSILKSWIDKIF